MKDAPNVHYKLQNQQTCSGFSSGLKELDDHIENEGRDDVQNRFFVLDRWKIATRAFLIVRVNGGPDFR